MLKSKTKLFALSLTAAALFTACVSDNQKDDANIDLSVTPQEISAKTAGPAVAGSLDQNSDWANANTTSETPTLPTDLTSKLRFLQPSTSISLLKVSANTIDNPVAGVIWDDSSHGSITIYDTKKTLGKTEYDTVIVKWDANAKDTIKDNEHYIKAKIVSKDILGKIETAEFSDLDGDGIINAVPGSKNLVRINFSSEELGITEHFAMDAAAGPDNNFDKDTDNQLLAAKWTRTKGGEIVAQGEYLDGDGDGFVTDNTKASSIVKVSFFEINPKNKPLVKKTTVTAKIRVIANNGGDEPISFSTQEELVTGRTNSVSMQNRLGSDEMIKDDTLWVTIATMVSTKSDTLRGASVVFVMNPGHDLKSEADDSLYAIHAKHDKKLGWERHTEFNLISTTPILHGEKPVAGMFDWKANYANGKSASAEGSFAVGVYHATFTGPEGNTLKVNYDAKGEIVAQ